MLGKGLGWAMVMTREVCESRACHNGCIVEREAGLYKMLAKQVKGRFVYQ